MSKVDASFPDTPKTQPTPPPAADANAGLADGPIVRSGSMAETDPFAAPPTEDPRVHATTAARSNRGFWAIAAALGVAGAVVIAGAVLTRPQPPGSSARLNLERAVRAANIVQREGGSYSGATAHEVGVVELTLTFVPGNRPSDGPTVVSVHPEADAWIAAARASDGSCSSVRVEANQPNDPVIEREVASQAPCSADAVATGEAAGDAAP
jgi:hypothetical protein